MACRCHERLCLGSGGELMRWWGYADALSLSLSLRGKVRARSCRVIYLNRRVVRSVVSGRCQGLPTVLGVTLLCSGVGSLRLRTPRNRLLRSRAEGTGIRLRLPFRSRVVTMGIRLRLLLRVCRLVVTELGSRLLGGRIPVAGMRPHRSLLRPGRRDRGGVPRIRGCRWGRCLHLRRVRAIPL
jgi:hypothetical protein